MAYMLGARKDTHDHRDRLLAPAPSHIVLPPSVNVFQGMSLLNLPVFDQGNLGSCTANAGALYRLWLYLRFAKSPVPTTFSRLWLYFQERKIEGTITEDAGAQSRTIFQVLQSLGCAPETDDPYNIAKFADPLANDNAKDDADAAKWKIGSYHRITSLDAAKQCLAIGAPSGYPISIGFTVYSSFFNIKGDGMMPIPGPRESIQGGHEVVVYGYDDSSNVFTIQNSWGESWGKYGTFFMPYKEFDRQISNGEMDAWMGHLGKW